MTTTKDKVITFRVAEHLHEQLRRVAAETGVSVSDLVRLCLQSELPRMKVKYGGIKQ